MKYSTLLLYTILPVLLLLNSCEKGKDITEPGFGKLAVLATFDDEAKPILIKVDGEIKDTLTFEKQSSSGRILLEAGKRKVSLVNLENNKTLIDTSIQIEIRKTVTLPRFWYRGTTLLFDNYNPVTMPKPARENILMRFISASLDLPADMKLKFIVIYRAGRSKFRVETDKEIAHVKRDGFSDYIELPDYKTLIPEGASGYYVIEGYDNITGDKVIGNDGENALIFGDNGTTSTPNSVWSQAITAESANVTIFSKNL